MVVQERQRTQNISDQVQMKYKYWSTKPKIFEKF